MRGWCSEGRGSREGGAPRRAGPEGQGSWQGRVRVLGGSLGARRAWDWGPVCTRLQ